MQKIKIRRPDAWHKNRLVRFSRKPNFSAKFVLFPFHSIAICKRLYKHRVLNFTCLTAVNFGFETRTSGFFPKHFQTNWCDRLLLSFVKIDVTSDSCRNSPIYNTTLCAHEDIPRLLSTFFTKEEALEFLLVRRQFIAQEIAFASDYVNMNSSRIWIRQRNETSRVYMRNKFKMAILV